MRLVRSRPTAIARALVLPVILPVVLSIVLLSGTLLTGCSRATSKPDPKVAATPDEGGKVPPSQTPVQPPPPMTAPPATSPPPSDEFSSSGLPSDVADALRRYVQGDERYTLGHWLALEDGSHLVELRTAPTAEHLYMWVPCGGKDAQVLVGLAEAPVFADTGGEGVRFLCTRVGDTYGAFPYYEVVRPGGKPEEKPFFKTANAGAYVAGNPGLAYDLRSVASTTTTLDLLFMITGPEPGGVMAGGSRPPLARISESPGSVIARFSYVTLAPGTLEAISSFTSEYARVTRASWIDGCLEVRFSVPWKYAVTFAYTKAEPQPDDRSESLRGYRFSFLPKAQDPEATGETLHQAATAVAGIRVGDVDVTAPATVSDLQERLLQAFPARGEPATAQEAADFALLTGGQWRVEKQAYVAGDAGKPDLVRWQGRWYELDAGFDALWKAARSPDSRDSMGETPEAVVRRYLQAMMLKDWAASYECLGLIPKDVPLSRYVDEMKRSGESYVDARIAGHSLTSENSAKVYVTYTYRWSNGTERTFEKEPWACVKENGVWKVRWLARQ